MEANEQNAADRKVGSRSGDPKTGEPVGREHQGTASDRKVSMKRQGEPRTFLRKQQWTAARSGWKTPASEIS